MKKIAIASNRHLVPYDSAFKYKQDFVNEAYIDCIVKANALPVILPYLKPLECEHILEPFDALLLPGGPDINPALYGEEKKDTSHFSDSDLDRYQQTLISLAQKENKPILGICRGLQLINVVYGGTLFQDIETEKDNAIIHNRFDSPYQGVHTISILEDSFLSSLFTEEKIVVNSLHHQGIKTLGYGLKGTAFSQDGLIEAIEGDGILAVQWHPESMGEDMESLFKAFTEEFIHE